MKKAKITIRKRRVDGVRQRYHKNASDWKKVSDTKWIKKNDSLEIITVFNKNQKIIGYEVDIDIFDSHNINEKFKSKSQALNFARGYMKKNGIKKVSYAGEPSRGILIGELSGIRLKKDLGLRRVAKRWHNRNNTGGNFGINLYPFNGTNYDITGYHDLNEEVYSLSVGELYQGGVTIFKRDTYRDWDYARLIKLLKRVIKKGTWGVR